MNNNTQIDQSSKKSYFKSLIKPFLLVLSGFIVGAGIVSVFLFLELMEKEEDEVSDEAQTEIRENFEDDIADSFSALFDGTTEVDIYMMEKRKDTIGVFAVISLSDEQFEKVFRISLKDFSSEQLEMIRGLIIIARGEYENKEGEWVLKEEPKLYQGMNLDLPEESLDSNRDKAMDASIKADLSSMRSAAEFWAINHDDSYDGFCTGPDAQETIDRIAENGKVVLCDDTATTWAAFSPLYDTTAQCFCADYRGTLKELNNSCPKEAVTVCP